MSSLEIINQAINNGDIDEQKELVKIASPLGLFKLAQSGDITVAAIIATKKDIDRNITEILLQRGSTWINNILAITQK